MSNLVLNGEERQTLSEVVLQAYAEEGTFSQFVRVALDFDYSHQTPGNTYAERVFNLIGRLESEGWLREFVRKVTGDRPLSEKLRAFVDRRLTHEGLVGILDQSGIEWPELMAAARGSLPAGAAGELATLPAATDPRLQARVRAARIGDLVDAMGERPEAGAVATPPLHRFALHLLEQAESEDVASRLREWIRSDARAHGIAVADAVIVYFADDQPIARTIVDDLRKRSVQVEELVCADSTASWSAIISRAREQIGRTMVLMSAATEAKWRALEVNESEATPVRSAVFVVLAGLPPSAHLVPRFVSSAPVSWAAAAPAPQELTLIADRITRASRSGRARAAAADTQYVSGAAQKVAEKLRTDEVVLLIGPAASWPPYSYEFARALLGRLQPNEGGVAPRRSSPGLGLPADLAGTYCAMKVGDDSFGNLVETTWKSLAGPKETPQYIPEAYKLIGKLVVELPRHQQKIRSLTPVNRRPLVVSTNRDLMLERALLLNGVPFTRVVVVQSYINPNGSPVVRFVVNQYGASVREGMLTLAGWPAPIDVKAQNFTELDDAIFRCQWSEVGTVEEVNQILGDISGPLILYKCFGSYDHPGGCAIAIEHYEALSNEIVPRDIIRKVQTKPLLLLGYSCTDPEWRYLRRTLLRSLPPGVDARYVVQYPLPDGEQEVNFEIERALEDRAGALWQRANISNYLIAHGDTVLTEIIRQLPNAGR